MGASVVTFVTYCLYCFGLAYNAFRVLRFPVQLLSPMIILIASCVVALTVSQIDTDSQLFDFIIKGGLATIILGGIVLAIDPKLRTVVIEQFANRLRQAQQA